MKKSKNISNSDSLEREIYRLKLQAKNIESQFDENLDYLQKNYSSMAFNSFFSGTKKDKENIFSTFIKNDAISSILNKVTCHIGDRVMENIDGLVDRAFHNKDKSRT
jgi:hypothetical protein